MANLALSALSNRQAEFIEAIADLGATSPITRSDLLDYANEAGWTVIPTWITKDDSRRVRHGVYSIPELVGEDHGAAAVSTAAPVATAAPAAASTTMNATLSTVETDGTEVVIPSKRDTYVPWGYFSDLHTILSTNRFFPVFITGLSGNGKTTMVEQVCAKAKREWVRLNITKQTNEDDLLGGFRLINGETVWVDGPVTVAAETGAVLCLDEIDMGGHLMMCLQPVLEGKPFYLKKVRRWVTPKAGFTVVATANTKGKGSDDGRFAGAQVMNEAMLDRFAITMEQDYPTIATEKKILNKVFKSLGVNAGDFAEHLVKWADITRKAFKEGAVSELISTRRLEIIATAFSMFDNKEKAIAYGVGRFDEETKDAFRSLYEKIDGEMKGDTDEAMDKINLETADDSARLDLSTTYPQKDEVKGRGARWDDTKRTWYITVSEWKQDPDFWNNFAPTLIETSDCPF